MRGKLIVFEGLDRAGKSTQCERLVETLQKQGKQVKHMRFPDRTTPIGQMINNYLKGAADQEDHVIHLLFSANRWEAAASIRSAIESGTTVIVDRYYYSGIVYSAAKHNPTLPLDWARNPDVGLPRPDVVLFLSISPEEATKRGGFGEEKYETTQMQKNVRALFGQIIESTPDGEDFVTIDANGTLNEVQRLVTDAAVKCFERVDAQSLPLRVVEKWPENVVQP